MTYLLLFHINLSFLLSSNAYLVIWSELLGVDQVLASVGTNMEGRKHTSYKKNPLDCRFSRRTIIPHFSIFWCVVALSFFASVCAPTANGWQIEHLFVDDLNLDKETLPSDELQYSRSADNNEDSLPPIDPSPMLFKCAGSCDRQGVRSGTRIEISGSKWPSINKRPFVLEATSGWFFVLEEVEVDSSSPYLAGLSSRCPTNGQAGSNNKALRAVRPTEEEYNTIYDSNEKGYLTKKSAGTFKILQD